MPDSVPSDPRIPVTLLTGFLGSGKTTLLNALLRSASAGRVAVIINEFGDIGLDHDLIEEATEEMVLMESGCLCCSIRGDLVRTMSDLARRQANGLIAFDRVMIETTGLADPAPIQQTLIVDRAAPNINFALGDGAQAGTGAHASLVFPGFITPLEVTA